jgi:pilus assembly protein CpaB
MLGIGATPKPVVPLPTTAPVIQTVPIVVTAQAVARGTAFTESVLTTIPYPKDKFNKDILFTDIKDVVGKKASIDLPAGVPVFSKLVVDIQGGSFAAFQIPKGLVAISIPIKDRISAMSFGIQPGDHVDVIVTLLYVDLNQDTQTLLPDLTAVVTAPNPGDLENKIPPDLTVKIAPGTSVQGKAALDPTLNQPVYLVPSEKEQRPRMVSQTLLQDAIILQVGDFQSSPSATQPTPTTGPTPVSQPKTGEGYDVITLMVPPQDAITLNYLVYAGAKLTLVLRSAGDDERVQTDAVTLQYLMDKYAIPLPAKQPYGIEPRVDNLEIPIQPTSQYSIFPTPTPAH